MPATRSEREHWTSVTVHVTCVRRVCGETLAGMMLPGFAALCTCVHKPITHLLYSSAWMQGGSLCWRVRVTREQQRVRACLGIHVARFHVPPGN